MGVEGALEPASVESSRVPSLCHKLKTPGLKSSHRNQLYNPTPLKKYRS